MRTQKIESTLQGEKRVNCVRLGFYKDAHECEKCKRFVEIDPVRAVIKCRERI
jgi:hypothetical protein